MDETDPVGFIFSSLESWIMSLEGVALYLYDTSFCPESYNGSLGTLLHTHFLILVFSVLDGYS